MYVTLRLLRPTGIAGLLCSLASRRAAHARTNEITHAENGSLSTLFISQAVNIITTSCSSETPVEDTVSAGTVAGGVLTWDPIFGRQGFGSSRFFEDPSPGKYAGRRPQRARQLAKINSRRKLRKLNHTRGPKWAIPHSARTVLKSERRFRRQDLRRVGGGLSFATDTKWIYTLLSSAPPYPTSRRTPPPPVCSSAWTCKQRVCIYTRMRGQLMIRGPRARLSLHGRYILVSGQDAHFF